MSFLARRGSTLASRRLVDVSIGEESATEEKRDRSSSRSEPTESSEDELYYNNPVNNILCLQVCDRYGYHVVIMECVG